MRGHRYYLKILLAALLGMLVLVSLFGHMTVPLGALELEVSLQVLDQGHTRVVVPPFGTVNARTHLSPLGFQVVLKNINLDLLQDMIPRLEEEEFIQEVQGQIWVSLGYFFFRVLLLGFLGGGLGVYLLGVRDIRHSLLGGTAGMLLICLMVLLAAFSYDIQAFANPEFQGVLSAAPWMVGLIEESLVKVTALGEQMQILATNIFEVMEKVERLEPLGTVEGDIRVLHVSDIHNNPAGVRFINQVINTFAVDLVIDTGDMTDFGTPLEAELIAQVAEFEVPYIFIPGNHDSPESVARLGEIGQVVILEEGVVRRGGVAVAGIADPSSRSGEMRVASQEVLQEYGRRLEGIVQGEGPVDIAASHHARVTRGLVGKVPVILHGHTHTFNIREEGGTVIIDAGTSGAAGIRGLQARQEVPYSVVLLHFNRVEGVPRLEAADIIKVFQLQSSFSLERFLFVGNIEDEQLNNP